MYICMYVYMHVYNIGSRCPIIHFLLYWAGKLNHLISHSLIYNVAIIHINGQKKLGN